MRIRVLGSAGGIAWSRGAWPGVTLFCLILAVLALVVALLLSRIPPLPMPETNGPGLPAA